MLVKNSAVYIACTLLLAIMLVPLTIIVGLQGWQLYWQCSVEERLGKAALEKIVIPNDEFLWEEENREIRVNGKLFDVKSYTRNNESVVVLGVFDEKETFMEFMLQGIGEDKLLIEFLLLSQLL